MVIQIQRANAKKHRSLQKKYHRRLRKHQNGYGDIHTTGGTIKRRSLQKNITAVCENTQTIAVINIPKEHKAAMLCEYNKLFLGGIFYVEEETGKS